MINRNKIKKWFYPIIVLAVLLQSNSLYSKVIIESPEDVCPILIGQSVSQIRLKDIEGNMVDLGNLVSEKPAIIIFYRGGWCPFCNNHLSNLEGISAELIGLGYQLIAISPDLPEKEKITIDKNKLSYTLLSDSKMRAAKHFGVSFTVDNITFNRYVSKGLDLEIDSGETHHLLPVPSVFIVGRDQKIKFSHVNPDYKARMDASTLLAVAKALTVIRY